MTSPALEQLMPALIALAIALLTGLAILVGAGVVLIRGALTRANQRQQSTTDEFVTYNRLAADALQLVVGEARDLKARVDKQDDTIVTLREGRAANGALIERMNIQLEEIRSYSRARDERLGELKANYEHALAERNALAERVSFLEARMRSQAECDEAVMKLNEANLRILELEAQIRALQEAQRA